MSDVYNTAPFRWHLIVLFDNAANGIRTEEAFARNEDRPKAAANSKKAT